tara:strand:- start:1070 stop:1306 length:237 start_codon:yes stop_codon:yes gene_type:complete
MFGILEKMDRFSNNLMTQDERIDFIQELVDTGMVYDMHDKYQEAAAEMINSGKVVCLVLRRKPTARVARMSQLCGVAL